MKRFGIFLTVLLFFTIATRAPAYGQCQPGGIGMDISVLPSQPSGLDSITIEVSGAFSDGCWEPAILDSFRITGNTISIYSFAQDNWTPPMSCPLVIVPFQFKIKIGPLPVGNYTVISSMQTNSFREQSGLCTSNFTVSLSNPIPSLNSYGFAVFALLLIGSMLWMIRKRMVM